MPWFRSFRTSFRRKLGCKISGSQVERIPNTLDISLKKQVIANVIESFVFGGKQHLQERRTRMQEKIGNKQTNRTRTHFENQPFKIVQWRFEYGSVIHATVPLLCLWLNSVVGATATQYVLLPGSTYQEITKEVVETGVGPSLTPLFPIQAGSLLEPNWDFSPDFEYFLLNFKFHAAAAGIASISADNGGIGDLLLLGPVIPLPEPFPVFTDIRLGINTSLGFEFEMLNNENVAVSPINSASWPTIHVNLPATNSTLSNPARISLVAEPVISIPYQIKADEDGGNVTLVWPESYGSCSEFILDSLQMSGPCVESPLMPTHTNGGLAASVPTSKKTAYFMLHTLKKPHRRTVSLRNGEIVHRKSHNC